VIYIIGSGLSGIAAAAALIKRGYHPTILDAGLTPAPDVLALKARLAAVEPESWNPDDLDRLRRTGPPYQSGIPQKLSFGSDFAYRDIDPSTSVGSNQATLLRSFAQGGFSNVWGAVIQAFSPQEFQSWPVSFHDVSRHYATIHQMIRGSDAALQPSTQARALHNDLALHREELEKRGIRFDYATLAVRTADDDDGKSCKHCGLCLYGCPYDSIFAANLSLSQLVRNGNASHVSGVIVDRVRISDRNVRIEARSVHDGSPRIFDGCAAFVAAGLTETARIVLNSTAALAGSAPTLNIQQSDIFTVPMLRYQPARNIDNERIHTLCQMIISIADASISRHPVELQLYGYNDLYPVLLKRNTGALSRPLRRWIRAVSERLFVGFGYLHSEESSRLRLIYAAGGNGRLRLEGEPDPESRRIGRSIAQKLLQSRSYLRALTLPSQVKFDIPGAGLRNGGCFPMRRSPVELETDVWGRLPGLPYTHIVDSSVLPSLPAGPVAFTVMANAHRIASECPIDNAA
jgi:ferredoxin